VSRHLLDTTVLIAHLRGQEPVRRYLLSLLGHGHDLCISCVNIAEVEHGLRPAERKAVTALLDRLQYLITSREAARRAGRYQTTFGRRGETLSTADALIAGTARAHGAVIVTDNLKHFPMTDIRKVKPPLE
jgi:predicted nucleic acid-binding protein